MFPIACQLTVLGTVESSFARSTFFQLEGGLEIFLDSGAVGADGVGGDVGWFKGWCHTG